MQAISPARSDERSKNILRPDRLDAIVGQEQAKNLMWAAVQTCRRRTQVLDHVLLVAPSGTGKTTFSHAVGNELGVDVYDIEAPISFDTLAELRTTMQRGDILKIEEIHQQAIMERRGMQAATRPEVLYAIMEDRVMPTQEGLLPFPEIAVIGTTTDEGMLPDAFVNRFPLRPRLRPYSEDEAVEIATMNAEKLELEAEDRALRILARASRGVPREINNLMRNAQILAVIDGDLSAHDALQVLELNGLTEDGLTDDMQAMLTFLYRRARQENKDGDVVYQASVNTIATAIGKSRDSKAIALRVEPHLIGQGYVQVTHGGRRLTDAGIQRARELLGGHA